MTIINHTYGFAFIHVPKNAGTAVARALMPLQTYRDVEVGGTALGEALQEEYRKRYGIAKHTTVLELRQALGPTWDNLRAFAVLRDPVDRVASTFAFLGRWTHWQKLLPDLAAEFRKCRTLDDFVRSPIFATQGPDRILEPQTFWITDAAGELGVERLMLIETLERDLRGFMRECGVLGLDRIRLPRANESGQRAADALSADSEERVRVRYARDYELISSIGGQDAQRVESSSKVNA